MATTGFDMTAHASRSAAAARRSASAGDKVAFGQDPDQHQLDHHHSADIAPAFHELSARVCETALVAARRYLGRAMLVEGSIREAYVRSTAASTAWT